MSALTMALIAFVCTFGGALLGAFLRPLLSGHHVSTDSRAVRVCEDGSVSIGQSMANVRSLHGSRVCLTTY
jgi:hypothetical protein